MIESVDRRVLGAFRCIDAITGNSVVDPLRVSNTQLLIRPNRSGIYVIFDGRQFESLTTQFIPDTPWPNPQPFEVTIKDPSLRYLSRRAQVQTPEELIATGIATIDSPPVIGSPPQAQSPFDPQRIILYPSPSAGVAPNWAVIRASVVQAGTNPPKGLPWAVLRVSLPTGNNVLATGMADARGEALLAIPGLGVQPSQSSHGSVTESTVDVRVDAWFDPTVLTQPPGWIPNPDEILNRLFDPELKNSAQSAQIGAGQTLSLSFAISV